MVESRGNFFDHLNVKLLLDAITDGVFMIDREGIIRGWNPAMEKITGFTSGEAIGQTCRLLVFDRCFGECCPDILNECQLFSGEEVTATESSLRHQNGRNVPVLRNARAIHGEDGSIIGAVETVTDLTELKNAHRAIDNAKRLLKESHGFGNIIGKSLLIQEVYETIKMAAASNATVLIQGESGTGKELVAGAIHWNSARKDGPMIRVNCSALPEQLLESEMFGHVKGSFTGAMKDRVGRFEEADGGTIFLDEISQTSHAIQLKLLRVLQEHEIERVGESKPRKIDIRVVIATNQDLFAMVRKGEFREDLYYRLKVFPINLPALRNRKEDIPLLVNHFVEKFNRQTGKEIAGISEQALRVLFDYLWPGNVRELENAIEHAFVLCRGDEIELFDLPVEVRRFEYNYVSQHKPQPARQKLEKEKLLKLLNECNWNKAEVARRVGLSRTAVWKYMKRWGIPLKRNKTT